MHQRLITYAADQVGAQLPDDLRARIEERVFVETEAEQIRRIVPDVYVAPYPPAPASHSELAEGGAVVAEPMVFLLEDEAMTEGYIIQGTRGGGKGRTRFRRSVAVRGLLTADCAEFRRWEENLRA